MSNILYTQKFNFSNVKGISENQLMQHYKLYEGYVNKTNEIWGKLNRFSDFSNVNSTYSKMRSLKLGESYALDGVKLHELYFQNMDFRYNKPFGDVLKLIERDFGTYDRFYNYFKSVGLSMRGWCILSIDSIDERLHIYGQDLHDNGVVCGSIPLLVLDVYEHAYMIDFGTDRKKYIDIFINNINWNIVNKRLNKYEYRMI